MNRQNIGHAVMPFAYIIAGVVLVVGITFIAAKALAITGFDMLIGVEE